MSWGLMQKRNAISSIDRREWSENVIIFSFFFHYKMKFFVCITYKINEEKLRTCIKGGPINNRRAASTLSILSSFFLTNHTSFVYLCTRAFNNRFWPRFNFTLFTYKIDWNVFVITKPKTQVAYDYFLHLSNLLFPQMTWEESYPLYEKKRIDDSFGLEWIYLPNMLALLLRCTCWIISSACLNISNSWKL